ncbi:hypothetical protein [Actinoplanes sp. NPDC049265]|uniref:hypothetical protein n=1 Tax=Actinoplanes sp. NPDC049265 TaxID=3363902 RepID=UPI003710484C
MSQPPYPGPPDPWSSGQPSSGQPSSGQPYPGQPASGQPSSGQPYPGQPASGQPYPSQPASDPYAQPQYPPTQPYPAAQPYPPQPPQPPQPGAYPPPPDYSPPPPDYGQQQQQYAAPGYPPMTAVPAVRKKSRALPITLVSIAVFLVLCVGGTTAVVLVARNTANSVENNAQNYTPPTLPSIDPIDPIDPAPTTEPPAAKTITIVEPRTLGGRPKLTDDQFQDVTDQLKADLGKIPNARNTVGALYGQVAKQNIVVIAGVEADVDNPSQELSGTFLGAGVGGLKVTGITSISAGPLGGVAKCGKADASGIDMVLCGWADEGSVGWIIWYFKTISKAKTEFAALRGQIEKSS